MTVELKAAVTVAEMARMAGLSRSRMYQLIGKAFPKPSRDENGRPYFDEEQQQIVLQVRRRNCGIDGKPILFYAARNSISAPAQKRRPKAKPVEQHGQILEAVKALGLVTVTATQISRAIDESFPNGIEGVEQGDVIRAVFLSLNRQN